MLSCLKLKRPPQILHININCLWEIISKKVFNVNTIMFISPLLMTTQTCLTTTATKIALALSRTNILSGFTSCMPLNLPKCPYDTNMESVWTSYILLAQIQACNSPLILLELHEFTEREIFTENFIKRRNTIFNAVISLLANQIESTCMSTFSP